MEHYLETTSLGVKILQLSFANKEKFDVFPADSSPQYNFVIAR
jgi:hypothetical protein